MASDPPQRATVRDDTGALVRYLLDVGATLGSDADFGTRMGSLCRLACDVIDCDRASIFLLEGRHYHARFNHGNPPDIAERFATFRVRDDDPLVRRAVEIGSYVVINEAATSELIDQTTARLARINAIVVAPLLRDDGTPLGFMTCEYNERIDRFNELQSMTLLGISRIASSVVTHEEVRAEREALAVRLGRLERLESIGRLAGGVAHDFNNLLTVILGNCDLVERYNGRTGDDPDAVAVREALAQLRSAAERASTLAGQLLAVGRGTVVRPRRVDVRRLLDDLVPLLERLMPATIDIELIGPGELFARIDPGEFERVLINLAVNARDAMRDGGRLTIATRSAELTAADAAALSGAVPGGYVVVAVSDDGVGMTPEITTRLFEPFFTTGSSSGVGLGLAIVHGIVRQSRGAIAVRSAPGEGTTFEIYLPLEAGADPAPLDGGRPEGSHVGTETVLVVDDVDAVRQVTAEILRTSGYTVLEASGTDEAVATARDHGGPIDLVVTDVVLAGSNGRELTERLRRERPGIGVVYMSGHARDVITDDGELPAGVAYLAKPFTAMELAGRVRTELDSIAT